MKGTEKQIMWAEDIRDTMIRSIKTQVMEAQEKANQIAAKYAGNEKRISTVESYARRAFFQAAAGDKALYGLSLVDDARFFIDNRTKLSIDSIRHELSLWGFFAYDAEIPTEEVETFDLIADGETEDDAYLVGTYDSVEEAEAAAFQAGVNGVIQTTKTRSHMMVVYGKPSGMTKLEEEQAREYSDIWSVIECLYAVLADFAKDFDVYAIAQELIFFKDGKLYANLQREDFWDIVWRHELSCAFAGYERDWDSLEDRKA